jgi:hypothetical protein
MTQNEKKLFGEMLDLMHKQSATIAALEEAATSPTLGGRQLTMTQVNLLRNKHASAQQSVYQRLATLIHDLPNT